MNKYKFQILFLKKLIEFDPKVKIILILRFLNKSYTIKNLHNH